MYSKLSERLPSEPRKDPMNIVPRSVKGKLIFAMASTLILVGLATFASVWWQTDEASVERQAQLEQQIRANLQNKGNVLAKSHAIALGPLAVDNAFSDVKKLVEQTVASDPDIVYGLFLSAEKKPWAYVSPTHPAKKDAGAIDLDSWKELRISDLEETQRELELFSQPIMEFSRPVLSEGETLGTIRYGITVDGLRATLAASRDGATRSKNKLLMMLSLLGTAILLVGVILMIRVAHAVTHPLSQLTEGAKLIAGGERSHRVRVDSGDEVEVLAGAFNDMLEENEKQFVALEKTTEQALQASRLKSEFLANMSHEIRTPMNGVLGMIKLVLRQPLDTKARRYADTVQASAHALMTIVNDILDFSKMEAGKYSIQETDFDPRTILQEVSELLSTRAQEGGVELIYRVEPGFPGMVNGDPDRFRQVLNNLIGNAVKFTDEGEIFIEMTYSALEDARVRCQVAVVDSGVGIPPEALESLFDAFSQADGSMVRKHGGTGLGLTISRRLAKMMGGDISVESTLGVGSKFTVWFEFEARERPESSRRLDWTTGKRIAVMEPSKRWTSVIREHLDAWGVESAFYRSKAEGLAGLTEAVERKQPFDALILGLRVTDDSAQSLIRAVRQTPSFGTIPIIVLTQLGASATLSEVAGEISAQVQKPLRLSELFNALQGTFLGTKETRVSLPDDERQARQTERPVLVVDDNEINQVVAVEELELAGYRTEVASDGAEALEKVKNGDYLLVLMDCQMPVMDGYTATQEIRKFEIDRDRRTPIIALTAHAMGGERERVLKAGMDDYLSKPFRPESLRKLMRQHGIRYRAKRPSLVPPAPVSPSLAPERAELTEGAKRSKRLMELFLKNVPGQLKTLSKAYEDGAADQVRAHAHKLKGSCLALDAAPMAEAAEAIQKFSEKGDLSFVSGLIEELETRYSRVSKLLEQELAASKEAV